MKNNLLLNVRMFATATFMAVSGIAAQAQFELDWVHDYDVANNAYLDVVATGVDGSNNYYVISNYEYTVDVDFGVGVTQFSPSNYSSMFIAKYNSAGTLLWGKKIGTQDANVFAVGAQVDATGNVYITGATGTEPGVFVDFDPGPGTLNLTLGTSSYRFMWVLKLTSAGDFAWVRELRSETSTSNTGVAPSGIGVDNDGNVFVTGLWDSDLNFTNSPGNVSLSSGAFEASAFVAKYNASGVFQWAKKFTQSTTYPAGISYRINRVVPHTSGLYLLGNYAGKVDLDPGPGFDTTALQPLPYACVVKLDLSGNYLWAKRFIGDGNGAQSYVAAAKVDNNGNLAFSLSYTAGLDVDFGPGTNILQSVNESSDILIGQFSSNGTLNWYKTIGNPNYESISALDFDNMGNIYLTGAFNDTLDFDPGAGVEEIVAEGNYDSFILKLTNSGNFEWVRTWGGSEYDGVHSMQVAPAGDIIICGLYTSTDMEFDPFRGGFSESWTYLMKLKPATSSINESDANGTFSVFPNPATSDINISGIEAGSRIRVLDISGKLILDKISTNETFNINTNGLANGVYVIQVATKNHTSQKKVVVNK